MKEKSLPKNKSVKTKPQPAVKAETIPTERPWWMDWLMNIWIFIPAVLFFNSVGDYMVNIPYTDDYDAMLDFLNNFSQAGFGRKMELLFSWHNEHKIVPSRIIYTIYYGITGGINFDTMRYLSCIQLLISFTLLVSFFRPMFGKLWGIPALIAGFCIFDLSNYFNVMCTMGGMALFGVLMFFMAALYFYNRNTKYSLALAGTMHALCILAVGSGVMASLCLVIFTIFLRDRKKIITSVSVAVVFTLVYFLVDIPGFVDPRGAPGGHPFNFSNSAMYFLNLNGAHFAFTGPDAISNAYFYGILMLILLALCIPLERRWKIASDALPVFIVLVFIMGTFATVARFRAIEGNHFYNSRYIIYPHIQVALAIVLLAYRLRNNATYKWAAVGVCSLLVLFTYNKNNEYGDGCFNMEYRRLTTRQYYYNLHGDEQKDMQHAKAIAERSCQLDIYCLGNER